MKRSRMGKTECGRMELSMKYDKHIIIPQEQGNHSDNVCKWYSFSRNIR